MEWPVLTLPNESLALGKNAGQAACQEFDKQGKDLDFFFFPLGSL